MAHRQEQERADPTVTEVAPNVLRMQLPIRLPGLGHVNMYALLDENGVALMDPGLPGPFTWRAIRNRLRQADLKAKDVHTVLITHSHPDHFGGARRFAREYGAVIVAHRSFRFGLAQSIIDAKPEISVNDLGEPPDSACGHSHQAASASGMGWDGGRAPWESSAPRRRVGGRLVGALMRQLSRHVLVPAVTQPVVQGDVLRLAGREMFVQHTPGHTEDHFCLHDPEAGVFFAGDHVLPTITPHISGLSNSEDPLQAFFHSLDRVAQLTDVSQVLPAHGHPFCDLAARTEAIKRHHHERLERIKEISREFGQPATVREYSQQLFRRRSWGAMAESETFAHLEHLRHLGMAISHRGRRDQLYFAA